MKYVPNQQLDEYSFLYLVSIHFSYSTNPREIGNIWQPKRFKLQNWLNTSFISEGKPSSQVPAMANGSPLGKNRRLGPRLFAPCWPVPAAGKGWSQDNLLQVNRLSWIGMTLKDWVVYWWSLFHVANDSDRVTDILNAWQADFRSRQAEASPSISMRLSNCLKLRCKLRANSSRCLSIRKEHWIGHD